MRANEKKNATKKTRVSAVPAKKSNIRRERRHKTAERERNIRSDRTRLAGLGRDWAIISPATTSR